MIGWFNGAISGGLNVEPFIVTLGTMYAVRGIALLVNNAQPVFGFPLWFSYISEGMIGPIPFVVVFAVIVAIICQLILTRTKFGRHLFAIGGNEEG